MVHTHWLFLPFVAVWKLIALILGFAGHLVGAVFGLVSLVVGLTLLGLIVGVVAIFVSVWLVLTILL